MNGGAQNRYVTGSDSVGMTMGHYNTRALPIYAYLHEKSHPSYVIEDNFFQAAFGGSFLNHQYLIAAAPPTYAECAGQSALDHRLERDAGEVPALHPDRPGAAWAAHGRLPVACRRARVRRLRGQHDAADESAVRIVRREAAAANGADDRRPVDGETRRLGLVLRRLVERRRRGRRSRLDERLGADVFRSERDYRLAVSALSGLPLPVPPSTVQLLRELRARDARA